MTRNLLFNLLESQELTKTDDNILPNSSDLAGIQLEA